MEDKVRDGSESVWLRIFRSPNLETHFFSREKILTHLMRFRDPRISAQTPHTPLENLIRPLLRDWDSIRLRAHDEMGPLVLASSQSDEDLRTVTLKYFGEFLTTGFRYLATFPDNWDSVIPVRIACLFLSATYKPFVLTTEGRRREEFPSLQ